MKTIFYARVSGEDQTLDHQLPQALAAGFQIDEAIADEISGVTTRLIERPQGRRLFDLLRAGDTLIVRWVDRLGRDYEDVSDNIREFMRRGVIIRTIINNMTFDGSVGDPIMKAIRDALIAFMAGMGQAQAEATKIAQKAGIAHAKTYGAKSGGQAYLGRKPSYTRAQLDQVAVLLASPAGANKSALARSVGLSRQTVLRIVADPLAARRALDTWAERAG